MALSVLWRQQPIRPFSRGAAAALRQPPHIPQKNGSVPAPARMRGCPSPEVLCFQWRPFSSSSGSPTPPPPPPPLQRCTQQNINCHRTRRRRLRSPEVASLFRFGKPNQRGSVSSVLATTQPRTEWSNTTTHDRYSSSICTSTEVSSPRASTFVADDDDTQDASFFFAKDKRASTTTRTSIAQPTRAAAIGASVNAAASSARTSSSQKPLNTFSSTPTSSTMPAASVDSFMLLQPWIEAASVSSPDKNRLGYSTRTPPETASSFYASSLVPPYSVLSSSTNNANNNSTHRIYQQAHRLLETLEVSLPSSLLRNKNSNQSETDITTFVSSLNLSSDSPTLLPATIDEQTKKNRLNSNSDVGVSSSTSATEDIDDDDPSFFVLPPPPPALWMEAEECLWNLSNLRTLESVDICFYLLDKLLLALHTQYQQQQRRQEQLRATANAAMDKNKQQQQPSEENFHPNPSSSPPPPQLDAFLTNWELWHSVLINWHQVSKTTLTEAMAKKNARRQQVQHDSGSSSSLDSYLVTSPAKLLAMLDGWNELVASTQNHLQTWQQQQQPPFSCTTSKTLSLLIDITARRGRILAEQKGPSHPPSASGLVQEAELAEKLLLDMMKKVDRPSGNRCPPSASNLNMVLMLWGKAGRVDEAWSLLKRASLVVTPDAISYNSILEGYAAVGNGPAAEKILFALCRPNSPVPPDVNTWNIVLAAWARFADKALAAQRVEQMLVAMVEFGIGNIDCDDLEQWGDDMDSLADSPGKPISPYRRVALWSNSNLLPTFGMHRPPIIRPNLSTFNTVLSVWARAGEAETCARLLGEMWDLHWEGRLDDPPDRVSYATVMNAFAKAGQPEKAEALADEMFKSYTQHGMVELKPTLANLTAVLDAYSRQIGDAVTKKDVKLALISLQRAQKMFQRMRYLYQFGYLEFCPDTTAYNVMLTCCLRCGSLNTAPQVNASAEIADTLLQEMKQMAGRHDKLSAPGFKTYSLVIQSWLLRPDGGRRAQALLQEIWDAQAIHQAPVQLRPDSLSLHCVIIGFCRELPFAALNLLLKVCEMIQHDPLSIVEPRLASFGSVLGALCRSNLPNAPGMSLDLVRRMEKLHQAGMIKQGPDRLMYRTLITVWAYADHIPGNAQTALSILSELRRRGLRNKDMLPDLRTYNQVLFALSRNNAAPAQAERLLRQMHDDYKNKVSSEKPDIRSFNSVLSAWARCTDPTSIARANSLFHEMQLLHQAGALLCDVVTYNIILNCLARSFRREGAIRAEQIVFQMNEMSATGNTAFRPNAVTYGCLIAAWLRVNDANRAATVLFDMHAAYTMGDEQMKPQFRHFQQVSVALSKIGDATSTEKLKHLSSVKDLFYSESIDQNFQNQRITKADP